MNKKYYQVHMFTRLCFLLILISSGGLCFSGDSEEDIRNKIPRSSDAESPAGVENFNYLVKLGEKAYPVLLQELQSTQDPQVASSIISILLSSGGDKGELLDFAKDKVVTRDFSSLDAKLLYFNSINAIGKVGGLQEAEFLVEALRREPDLDAQVLFLENLSKIGNLNTAKQINDWFKNRINQPWSTAQSKEAFTLEVEKSVEKIRSRIKIDSAGKDAVVLQTRYEDKGLPLTRSAKDVNKVESVGVNNLPRSYVVVLVLGLIGVVSVFWWWKQGR